MNKNWRGHVRSNSYRKVYKHERSRGANNRRAKAAAQTYGYGRFGVAAHGAMCEFNDLLVRAFNDELWGSAKDAVQREITGLSGIVGNGADVLIMDDPITGNEHKLNFRKDIDGSWQGFAAYGQLPCQENDLIGELLEKEKGDTDAQS